MNMDLHVLVALLSRPEIFHRFTQLLSQRRKNTLVSGMSTDLEVNCGAHTLRRPCTRNGLL
jgi:hypothetical protein